MARAQVDETVDAAVPTECRVLEGYIRINHFLPPTGLENEDPTIDSSYPAIFAEVDRKRLPAAPLHVIADGKEYRLVGRQSWLMWSALQRVGPGTGVRVLPERFVEITKV